MGFSAMIFSLLHFIEQLNHQKLKNKTKQNRGPWGSEWEPVLRAAMSLETMISVRMCLFTDWRGVLCRYEAATTCGPRCWATDFTGASGVCVRILALRLVDFRSTFLCLSFLVCKPGILVPTSRGGYEDETRRWHLQSMQHGAWSTCVLDDC